MKLLQGLSISAAWLLASSAAWAEGMQSQAAYPFSFVPQQGQQVSVTLSGNQASVQLPSGETQTLGEIEPKKGTLLRLLRWQTSILMGRKMLLWLTVTVMRVR